MNFIFSLVLVWSFRAAGAKIFDFLHVFSTFQVSNLPDSGRVSSLQCL